MDRQTGFFACSGEQHATARRSADRCQHGGLCLFTELESQQRDCANRRAGGGCTAFVEGQSIDGLMQSMDYV